MLSITALDGFLDREFKYVKDLDASMLSSPGTSMEFRHTLVWLTIPTYCLQLQFDGIMVSAYLCANLSLHASILYRCSGLYFELLSCIYAQCQTQLCYHETTKHNANIVHYHSQLHPVLYSLVQVSLAAVCSEL